jgi:acetyl esterase/lipase
MGNSSIDTDSRQTLRDICRPNRYALDDRFVLRDGKKHPFAVICPGGGYSIIASFIEGTPVARKLNDLGISAFIVYYRVRRKARWPHPQEDLARAVREILERAAEYGVDPNDYSVWGSSAGGHLVGSFGTENTGYARWALPKPRALVLIYPVISMEGALPHCETHDNLLGPHATAAMERAASIDRNVTADYPPTYLWCGDADASVDPENTRRMAAALKAAGIPFRCEIFHGVGHGVGPGTGTAAEGWIEHAVEFWRGQKHTGEE